MLARLLWESTIDVINVLAHSMMSWTSSESSEWDDGLMCDNILHVLDCLEQVESTAGPGSFIGVLKVSSQVINSTLGG